MSDHDNPLAQGMLTIAIRRLAKSQPFHAQLLAQQPFVAAPEVGTMGVTVRDAQLQFHYAPGFVCRSGFDELAGMLEHLVNHVLLGHLLASPPEYADAEAQIRAGDLTTTESIAAAVPSESSIARPFGPLSPGDDTATRHAHPARKTGRSVPKKPRSVPKKAGSVPKMAPSVPKKVHSVPKMATSGRKKQRSNARRLPEPLDNHKLWQEARRHPQLSRLVIANALRRAKQALGEAGWKPLPEPLRRQIDEAMTGVTADPKTARISSDADGTVDWRAMLQRLVASTVDRQPALHRAPRRFPELAGILPGRAQTPQRPHVMAVIDTSGSMQPDMLAVIAGELSRLARDYRVTLVECDDEIRAVSRFTGELGEVQGRGGTDLRPVFAHAFLKRIDADVIVYFTDGDGPAPEKPPKTLTIWCMIGEGKPPARWGKVVRIGK